MSANSGRMELLAPAGSPEALRAAVQSGADAVYLGAGAFNARRGAENFDRESLRDAVAYCHLRGVKVYLTLNTLLFDRELSQAAEWIAYANETGVDALLVQDLGVARIARAAAPDLPLHASTQMGLHDLDGVRFAADLGMTRAVLARELPREEIAAICAHSPIEIEVFVHGALCMCYSGQCFFSSVLGGRSGNRGLCAQPCRLRYGWDGRAQRPLLSLRDLCLADNLRELQEMGVACAKIEGRMRRPEYVAIVTRIYAALLREGRSPTAQELAELEQAFSRQGFTDGYYTGQTGPSMFGVREASETPNALFAGARRSISGEAARVPVHIEARVSSGSAAHIAVTDSAGHRAEAAGPVPEPARTRSLTEEQLRRQLSKLGGTPYCAQTCSVEVGEGLSLPLSALNAMRREALKQLSRMRTAPPVRRSGPVPACAEDQAYNGMPSLTLSLLRAPQLTEELLRLRPASIALTLEELSEHPDCVDRIVRSGAECAVTLPRILWTRERTHAEELLRSLVRRGVRAAYVSSWSAAALARAQGLTVRGDFGLGAMNSQTLTQMGELGFASAVLSFELKAQQVRALRKALDTELLVYGRLPLMITQNCIIKNRTGRCACRRVTGKDPVLTDRKKARFPVVRAYGCRNEILNSAPLYLADRPDLWHGRGLWGARLSFTTEAPETCAAIVRAYQTGQGQPPEPFTRGLYVRGVE